MQKEGWVRESNSRWLIVDGFLNLMNSSWYGLLYIFCHWDAVYAFDDIEIILVLTWRNSGTMWRQEQFWDFEMVSFSLLVSLLYCWNLCNSFGPR